MLPTAPHGLDDLDLALFRSRRWVRRPGHRRRFRTMLGSPLEFATLRLLRTVEQLDSAPTIGAAAKELDVDQSTASRLVERAVRAGLLHRNPDPSDGRCVLLRISEDGRARLDEANHARRTLLAEATEGWTAEDVATLTRLLERLGEGFDRLER